MRKDWRTCELTYRRFLTALLLFCCFFLSPQSRESEKCEGWSLHCSFTLARELFEMDSRFCPDACTVDITHLPRIRTVNSSSFTARMDSGLRSSQPSLLPSVHPRAENRAVNFGENQCLLPAIPCGNCSLFPADFLKLNSIFRIFCILNCCVTKFALDNRDTELLTSWDFVQDLLTSCWLV